MKLYSFFFSFEDSQLKHFFGGYTLNNLIEPNLSSDGLIGGLACAAADTINHGVCSVLGPDALQAMIDNNNCGNEIILPNAFKSYKHFCAYYNRSPLHIRECMTVGAARLKVKLRGIVNVHLAIGMCCKHCAGSGKL